MTTRRENLRKVLRGQQPGWVPFAPNFCQWFTHHKKFGTLPPELRDCGDYLDAMKAAQCDIFSRNITGGVGESNATIKPRDTKHSAPLGIRVLTEYDTPFGTLSRVMQMQDALTTSHIEEYPVKDWDRDGRAFRYLLDQKVYDWNETAFLETDRRVGDNGLVNVACGYTPLKMLHTYFGLDHSCLFVLDYPEEAQKLCDVYWAKLRPLIEQLAAHPKVESVILLDNVDTPFYPPALARDFWAPYVREAAQLMQARGKYLFVHACGKLKALSPIFADCGVNGLEGVSHPPLGDWTAPEAQQCHEKFIFIGGFSAHEQERMTDDQVRRFYHEYLPAASRSRFIFSASCQTAVHTPWSRIKLVRELCREWGGSSDE